MSNPPITYTLTGNGTLSTASGTADADGKASLHFTSASDPAGGTVHVEATIGTGRSAETD
jgi:hypothetical protein